MTITMSRHRTAYKVAARRPCIGDVIVHATGAAEVVRVGAYGFTLTVRTRTGRWVRVERHPAAWWPYFMPKHLRRTPVTLDGRPATVTGDDDDAAIVTDDAGRTMRLPWHDAIRTAAHGGRFSFNDR
jgi:hypothetical protein